MQSLVAVGSGRRDDFVVVGTCGASTKTKFTVDVLTTLPALHLPPRKSGMSAAGKRGCLSV